MRTLKIALVSGSYWAEHDRHEHQHQEGGDIQQLAEAVAALGHEVVVFSRSPQVGKLRKSQVGLLETWLVPRHKPRDFMSGLRDWTGRRTYSYDRLNSDALWFREFLGVNRNRFDVIWAHTESPDGLVVGMAGKLGTKMPPVLTQVQALRQRFEKGQPVFIDQEALGLSFRRAARILAASEMVAHYLPAYAGSGLTAEALKQKIHIVHPNLQRIFLRVAQDTAPLPQPMNDRVLFLGELNQARGALVFLAAIAKTQAALRNSTFPVIGDFTDFDSRFGHRWEQAKEEARIRMPGARMEFLGRVSPYEVMRQILLARIVVIPALFNPFSRGVLETLILGRPVITTDKVGSAALVQAHDCGLVVASHNSTTLAEAIDLALNTTNNYAENARRVAKRLIHDFSPEAIAIQVALHLSEIAAPPKR
jgi:glycosyltransferase involved in cell wall biosynthesis